MALMSKVKESPSWWNASGHRRRPLVFHERQCAGAGVYSSKAKLTTNQTAARRAMFTYDPSNEGNAKSKECRCVHNTRHSAVSQPPPDLECAYSVLHASRMFSPREWFGREGRRMRSFYSVNGSNGCSLRICEEFKLKLKAKGQTEVMSPNECDYLLAFCTISTRPGIDIHETMEKCPAVGKPVILVVLHHTYDHEKFVSPKAKEISSNILLSVDVMFYEGKMLECPHNEREFDKILEIVGYPYSTFNRLKNRVIRRCYGLVKPKGLLAILVVVGTLWFFSNREVPKKDHHSLFLKDSASLWNYLPTVSSPSP
ncbi:unnamed protein product [Arctogadus glacialis]